MAILLKGKANESSVEQALQLFQSSVEDPSVFTDEWENVICSATIVFVGLQAGHWKTQPNLH